MLCVLFLLSISKEKRRTEERRRIFSSGSGNRPKESRLSSQCGGRNNRSKSKRNQNAGSQERKYESVLVIDNNVMYAKVDKSSKVKSKIEEESQADESISDSGLENVDDEDITMFENTDLYDTVNGDKNNTCTKKNYDTVGWGQLE